MRKRQKHLIDKSSSYIRNIYRFLRKNKYRLYRIMLELVFPRRCPVCDKIVTPFGERICSLCRQKIRYIGEPRCKQCGKGLKSEEKEYCFDCTEITHAYKSGLALYEYTSVKSSIHRFKYQGRCEYADFYGADIAQKLGSEIKNWKPDVLIPVPIHHSKRNIRGYNQAELIADILGKELSIPVDAKFIQRCKKTVPQKELDVKGRRNNLKKAFKICKNDVKLKTIIIIDDIYTTGSTIDAIAKAFHKIGEYEIYYIALSIGKGF